MVELYQRILDEFGMPAEYTLKIVISVFMVMVDIKCSC